MVIKNVMVCDQNGQFFYNKSFNDFEMIQPELFSGLLSAIGSIGKQLFNEDIARISFGMSGNSSNIAVVSKEIFSTDQKIHFVFLYTDDVHLKTMRELSTTFFMETKNMFRNGRLDQLFFKQKIDHVITSKYNGLKFL